MDTAEATRKGAIHTIRRWWPDVEPMATRIRDFTRLSIQCLAKVPDDSDTLQENPRQTPGRYVPPSPTIPAEKAEVTQYVEGSLALSVKDPSFLEPYVHRCIINLRLSGTCSSHHLYTAYFKPTLKWNPLYKRRSAR